MKNNETLTNSEKNPQPVEVKDSDSKPVTQESSEIKFEKNGNSDQQNENSDQQYGYLVFPSKPESSVLNSFRVASPQESMSYSYKSDKMDDNDAKIVKHPCARYVFSPLERFAYGIIPLSFVMALPYPANLATSFCLAASIVPIRDSVKHLLYQESPLSYARNLGRNNLCFGVTKLAGLEVAKLAITFGVGVGLMEMVGKLAPQYQGGFAVSALNRGPMGAAGIACYSLIEYVFKYAISSDVKPEAFSDQQIPLQKIISCMFDRPLNAIFMTKFIWDLFLVFDKDLFPLYLLPLKAAACNEFLSLISAAARGKNPCAGEQVKDDDLESQDEIPPEPADQDYCCYTPLGFYFLRTFASLASALVATIALKEEIKDQFKLENYQHWLIWYAVIELSIGVECLINKVRCEQFYHYLPKYGLYPHGASYHSIPHIESGAAVNDQTENAEADRILDTPRPSTVVNHDPDQTENAEADRILKTPRRSTW